MDRLNRGGAVAYAASGTPTIDGKLDDPCWRHEGTRLVEIATGDPAPVDSRVWFACDDQAIHVAARLAEPEMNRLVVEKKKPDDAVYQDDSIEFFICPRASLESYAQIVINPNGVVFDGFKEDVAFYNAAKNFAIRQAIVKRPDGWDLEFSIPYAELGIAKFAPGSLRRINFIQNRGVPAGNARTRGCHAFAPTFGQSNHNTRFFGTVIFAGEERFREDFGTDVATRWQAEVIHKDGFTNPEAFAELVPGEDFATLRARMSKTNHVAQLVLKPAVRIPVRKGDQLELVYRGPLDGPIRAEITYLLTQPDGKTVFGWKPDNNAVVGFPLRRHAVDLWNDLYEGAKAESDTAELHNVRITLSSPPDSTNALELHFLIVSPHTAATAR